MNVNLTPLFGEGVPLGADDGTIGYTQPISHMDMVCSLGCQTTTVVYGTVWPQFAMQVLTRCCDPPVWEEDVVVLGLGMAPG